MPKFTSSTFCLSNAHHGLQRAEEGLPLGQQQLTHLLHLPAVSAQQRDSSVVAAALPCRYYTTNPGFLFPQRSEVPKQAFGFAPVFNLAHCCSISSSSSAAAATLSHELVVALRPTTDLVRLPSPSAAVTVQQQQRHRELCQQQQQQHVKHKQKGSADLLQVSDRPWLGAELDVGGYTKKGFISGGGKDQNQDRGLILEEFRSPDELLLGVMDGHGTSGHLVSTYLAQHLPAVLMQKLVAAAAAADSSSIGSSTRQQRRLFGRASKQQQQQQGGEAAQGLQFAISQVPYVVVPDHWPKYGFAPAPDTADCYRLEDNQQPGHTAGRAVGKQQLVQQLRSHPLDDADSSSSSSSSSSSGYSHSSSQKWLSRVSQQSVQQVGLSQELLSGAFTATDFFLSGSGINVVDSGSTALLCHVDPRSITTAWVGDSRAVLGRRRRLLQTRIHHQQQQQQNSAPQQQPQSSWEAIPLSMDHKPERRDESLRINLHEGRVAQIMGRGPYRVWFKGIDYPGLAMSRAFGDLPCRRIGVTVEPEVTVHPLRPGDELLIAASDGIWDVLSNEEVVSMAGNAVGAQAAARELVEVAEARWLESEGGYIDDITAVVVRATPQGATKR